MPILKETIYLHFRHIILLPMLLLILMYEPACSQNRSTPAHPIKNNDHLTNQGGYERKVFTSEPEGAEVYIAKKVKEKIIFSKQLTTPFCLKYKWEESIDPLWSFVVTKQGYKSIRQNYKASEIPAQINWRLDKIQLGFEGEFIAFSLSEAEKKISDIYKDIDRWGLYDEIYQIGGIRQIHGLVYDHKSKDIILIGSANPQRQPLSLDDLVVALRAKFIYGQLPLVSIDPPERTSKNRKNRVRFEGGIQDTQFGMDLFDADYRLKLIGLSNLPSGISGMPTYWDIWLKESINSRRHDTLIPIRFWFYPVLSSVVVRNGVAAIGNLRVQLFSQLLDNDMLSNNNLKYSTDVAAETFTKVVNDLFEEIGERHKSFSKFLGLAELVALTIALNVIEPCPDLSFWLEKYKVKTLMTPKTVEIVYRKQGLYEMFGGVHLMAIALRLKAGDISALKDAVLTTRPNPNSIKWTFSVGEWLIPTSPGMVRREDLNLLFTEADYFKRIGYDSEAINLLDKIINMAPDAADAYRARAILLEKVGRHKDSKVDLEKVRFLESQFAKERVISPITRGLVMAAYQGDTNALENFLSKGADVNAKAGNDYTALVAASEAGHFEIINKLMDRGSDVNAKNYLGFSALIITSGRGHVSIVKALLDGGANVNARSADGYTALQLASLYGHFDIVTVLLKNGADVNAGDNEGSTALHAASQEGHFDILHLLLRKGAYVNHINKDGYTALKIASKKGHANIVKNLIEEGAEINERDNYGITALMITISHGNINVVTVLLENEADVNLKTQEGQTALQLASYLQRAEIVSALLDNGAEVNAKANDGNTALTAASEKGNLKILKKLLRKGAEINVRNNQGATPLLIASLNGHVDAVKLLLESGANVNEKLHDGRTILEIVNEQEQKEIIRLLKRAGQ